MMNSIGLVVLYLVIGVVYDVALAMLVVVFLSWEYGTETAVDAILLSVYGKTDVTMSDAERRYEGFYKDISQMMGALFSIVTWPVTCTINLICFYQSCREVAESSKQ